jgi:CDP-diacylglycerol--serine O-phosphatidyltransferase
MIRQLADPANAITAIGIVCSVVGIRFALSGHPELGVAMALWALLADHLDGVVAVRTKGRAPETGKVGKSLDSLADLVSAGILPAVIVLQVGEASPFALAAAIVLVLASALRLSYFNAFGMPDGRFIGVPTTYAVPLLAILFLIRPWITEASFPTLLCTALIVLAVLHVSRLSVPPTKGMMYVVVTLFAVLSSVTLAMRGWST